MKRRVILLAALAMPGCGAQRPTPNLEVEVRRLRDEQERQARQIGLLESRVVLAEDSVRQVRGALAGGAPGSVRIGAVDEVGAALPAENETVAAEPDATGPRPVVRASGRERAPDSPTPIVVHGGDRLPVTPLPPPTEPVRPSPEAPLRRSYERDDARPAAEPVREPGSQRPSGSPEPQPMPERRPRTHSGSRHRDSSRTEPTAHAGTREGM